MITKADLEQQLLNLVPTGFCYERGPDDLSNLMGIIDMSTGDVIGSGETKTEALEDAIRTARGWEAS